VKLPAVFDQAEAVLALVLPDTLQFLLGDERVTSDGV
jgi:hypothetical protein